MTRFGSATFAVGVIAAVLMAPAAAAPACTLDDAVYGNEHGDWKLRFGPEALSRIQSFAMHLQSHSQHVVLSGDIDWNNGYAVPNFSLCRAVLDAPECEGDAILHGYQIYAMEAKPSGRIVDLRFVGLDDPAPSTILLPGLAHALYHALDFRDTGVKLPEDFFHFAGCED